MAIVGDYVLTRDKFRAITDYMGQKYDYKLNPEQEKEFIQFIVNKKLMAMDARSKGYADRPDTCKKQTARGLAVQQDKGRRGFRGHCEKIFRG